MDFTRGRKPVACLIRRGLKSQRAIALDDELGVVAGQREHDRAFALGVMVCPGHRLLERLIRQLAHLLEDGLAAGNLSLVVQQRNRRRVAGDEYAIVGQIDALIAQHILDCHTERAGGQAKLEHCRVGLER
jgi:hypothetical protein